MQIINNTASVTSFMAQSRFFTDLKWPSLNDKPKRSAITFESDSTVVDFSSDIPAFILVPTALSEFGAV